MRWWRRSSAADLGGGGDGVAIGKEDVGSQIAKQVFGFAQVARHHGLAVIALLNHSPACTEPRVPVARVGFRLCRVVDEPAQQRAKEAPVPRPLRISAGNRSDLDDLMPVDAGPRSGLPADRAGRPRRGLAMLQTHQGRAQKFAQDVGFLPPPVHPATTWS
jgi:flagellar biosynthesis protein FlhA